MPDRSVLIVDDEEIVRTSLQRTLQQEGYIVHVAEAGPRALEILKNKPVQLVISDNHMPEMTGVDLLKLVRVRHPDVLRIMLTGDPDPELAVRSINESEVYRFIRKPWNKSDLRTILHFAFEVIELEAENREMIALIRRQRAARRALASRADPAGLESELELLAEAEAALLGDPEV